MKPLVVADGYTLINTQGIRYVERKDVTYGGPVTRWELVVTYKGNTMTYLYPNAHARDAQFAALSAALTGLRVP